MANFKAINDAIETRFNTEITVGQSLPTIFANQGDDVADVIPSDGSAYLLMTVEFDRGRGAPGNGAVGSPRTTGRLHCEVYIPPGDGNSQALTIAGQIASAFDTYQTAGPPNLTFSPGDFTPIGNQGPSGYWQAIYDVPFFSDEV